MSKIIGWIGSLGTCMLICGCTHPGYSGLSRKERTSSSQDSESVSHSLGHVPKDEDYRFLEMDNDTAHVGGAIVLYMHRHGRPPKHYEQIRDLAVAVARPDTIDPTLTFRWKVTGPYGKKNEPAQRKYVVEVTVLSPVVDTLDYFPADGPMDDDPKGITY